MTISEVEDREVGWPYLSSANTDQLAAALAKAQAVMKNAPMDRINAYYNSRYATLGSVRDSLKPLHEHGLALTSSTQLRDGGFVLVTTLMHGESGQWVAAEWPLPLGAKPQEMGSHLTYARRYTISALINIATEEDDDANAAQAGDYRVGASKPKGPYVLQLPKKDDGTVDWLEYARQFMAGLKTARDRDQADAWLIMNKDNIKNMGEEDDIVHGKLTTAISARMKDKGWIKEDAE